MFPTLTTALLMATVVGGAAMAETFEVKMLNKAGDERMVFEPAQIRVAVGDTIKFIPTDKGHNAESLKGMAPEGAEDFAGKMSKEIEVTYDKEGLYGIQCKPHYAMGMVMTVAVGDIAEAPADFLAGRVPPKAKARFEGQITELFGEQKQANF